MKAPKSLLWLMPLIVGLCLVALMNLGHNTARAERVANICNLDGYSTNNYDHPVEWSGHLIGTMVSGEEIGLETVSGTDSPVFDVYLGEALNIDKIMPNITHNDTIIVKGYWQGIDCELYRGIYGFEKYVRNGQVCVPLIEATSIKLIN